MASVRSEIAAGWPSGRALLTAGAVGLLLLGPGQALAGACEKTTRDLGVLQQSTLISVNAHTVVRNDTSGTSYKVAIYQIKNGAQSGSSKQASGTISDNGEQVTKMLPAVDDTIKVVITQTDVGDTKTTCLYQVATKSKKTTWNLGDSETSACTGPVRVSCSKSFHSGKARWNTTFEIKDPAG